MAVQLAGMMKFFKDPSGIKFWMEKVGEKVWVHFKGRTFTLSNWKKELIGSQKKIDVSKEPYFRSPLPGRILSIKIKEGDKVQEGDSLMVIESMKIEHTLKAFQLVKIKSVLVKEGQSVEANEKLMLFD